MALCGFGADHKPRKKTLDVHREYVYEYTRMKYNPMNFSDLAETELGKKLWAYLTRTDSRLMMKTASKLKRPAVEGVAEELLEEFGDDVRADRIKQMVGHMVRQIMEAEGYQLNASHVPVRIGKLFTKASRYRKSE